MRVNPPTPSRQSELSRRGARLLAPAALLAIAPKCLLCLLAYVGLGAALGLGGPELCGASGGAKAPWESSLALLGVAGGLGAFGFLASFRRARPAPTANRNAARPASTEAAMAADQDAGLRQRDAYLTH
jgi:hypothetical protein